MKEKGSQGAVLLLWMSMVCSGHMHLPVLSPFNLRDVDDPSGYDLLFRSETQEVQDVPLTFSQPLPSWINGSLVRNGAGQFEMGPRHIVHMFDGFAKLSNCRFPGDGSAYFSTKFIRSNFYKDSVKDNTIAPYQLLQGTQPAFSTLERYLAMVKGVDNININLYRFLKDKDGTDYSYAALADEWSLYEMNPLTLDTERRVTAPFPLDLLVGQMPGLSSAHPLPEPGTSNHLTIVSTLNLLIPWEKHFTSLVRIRGLEQREEVARWEVDRLSHIHSFSVTETHAVLLAVPYFVDIAAMLRTGLPFSSMEWSPQGQGTTVYVVRLSDGHVTQLETEAMMLLHHSNAYNKEDGELVVDVCAYTDPSLIDAYQVEAQRDPDRRNAINGIPQFTRLHISLNSGTVRLERFPGSTQVPYSYNIELPTINEAHRSKHYCFVYGISSKIDNVTYGNVALTKKDLCSADGRNDRTWTAPLGVPMEAWFVPKPSESTPPPEDHGVLMLILHDGTDGTSYLLILDASDMSEVTRAPLPVRVPINFHGRFFQGLH